VSAPEQPKRCGNVFVEDGETLLCQLGMGHRGPHESGNWEWWVRDNRESDQISLLERVEILERDLLALRRAFYGAR
jgi:hypothetical protein